MSLTIAIISLITIILTLILHFRNSKRPKGFPPGPTPLPIVGNLHQIGLEPYKSFVKLGKKYGDIFSIDYGSWRSIVINDLTLLKKCLSDPAFSGRPKFRVFLERNGPHATYGRGIIVSEGQRWVEQRRFVLKNLRDFGFGKSSMEGIIQEEVQEVIETMRKTIGKPFKTRGLFNIAVVNSIWRVCTGVRMSHTDPKLVKLVEDIMAAFSAASPLVFFFPILTRIFPRLSGFVALMNGANEMTQFVTKEYDAHKRTFVAGEPRDLMDVLIEEVANTTDVSSSFYKTEGEASVIKSLEDLFLAGSDTTSTTLSWIFLFLALYPEIQQKLHKEIDSVIGQSRLPGLIDRQRMPFAECILMESLRFVSLVPLSIMHCATEDVNIGGYSIPKGTVLTPNLYAVMHNEQIWGDPENYRPERFLLPNGTVNKSHEAFLPFSYGKRICIGEKLARDEVFLFTTSLFQRFHVMMNPRCAIPSLTPKATFVLSPNAHELILSDRT